MRKALIALSLAASVFNGCTPEDSAGSLPLVNPFAADDQILSQRIAAIENNLTQLRGLNFTRPIRCALITRDEVLRESKASFNEMPDVVDRFYSRELAQLGFFPDTVTSLKALEGDFYGSFPAAYYVSGTDSIYVLSDLKDSVYMLQHILSHELTHALQDQNLDAFNPNRVPDPPPYYYGDYEMFRRNLTEGDAEFTSMAYVDDYVDKLGSPFVSSLQNSQQRKITSFQRWISKRPPQSFFVSSYVPYENGMAMAAQTYAAAGNWDSLNAMYRGRSRATRSVMTDSAQYPVPLDFSGVFAQLDTAGAHVDDEGLGCLRLMSLFTASLDSARFNQGMGWRGDRMLYVKKDADVFGTMVWAQIFDDSAAAGFAFAGFAASLPKRFQGSAYAAHLQTGSYPGNFDATRTFSADGLSTVLIRKGSEVWWLENTGARTDALVAALDQRPAVPAAKRAAAETHRPSWADGPPGNKQYFFPED